MQFATHKTATPPLAGELIAQQIIICEAVHEQIRNQRTKARIQ
jgi:hypothetical protein